MRTRIWFFYGILIVFFLLLLARLFQLQIVFGAKNRALADGNRIKKEVLPAPRGMIYDREGRELVKNVPLFRLIKREGGKIVDLEIITREEALRLEARGETENLKIDVGREYLAGRVLAHVLGYLGEANEEEVEKGEYQLGDLVGRMGIEEKYDFLLRGQDGGKIYEVDNLGNIVREMGMVEPVPGQALGLSLDLDLSQVAFEALEGRPGAVVVTEAKTGRVLVLVSSPSFNPNAFGKWSGEQSQVEEILTDPAQPMFNRAIGGIYPPGSTFKIVTAVAGLEEGKVDKNTTYVDTGEIRIGDYVYRNWYFIQYGKTEREIDLVRAIKRSTDTFFYKIGEWVGATRLAEWGRAFGLGKETGIDINGETVGLVPDPKWKEKTMGERWFLGNTYHFAIGQADLLATPLQVNMMTAIIANDGKLCSPKIAKNTSDSGPEGLLRGEADCQDLRLKKQTLQLVKEGMKEACSTGGTAFPLFDFTAPGLPAWPSGRQVACKTGTAEFGDPQGRTHAWLTAFAPVSVGTSAGKPAIVVTALVEAGGEGSREAAPIVKKVMERWFGDLD